MALAYGQKPRIVVEESPLARAFADIPSMVLSFMQLTQQLEANERQMEWKSSEAALDREFKAGQNELSIAAQDYRFLREQKAEWEKELVTKGYKLPDYAVTAPGKNLFDKTTKGYLERADVLEGDIRSITNSLALISEAADFAEGQADIYGDIIKAGEDEAWRDYLLEGGLEVGPEGGLIGTGEMAEWLKVQTPETIEKLKDANYRRSLLGGLRTLEEAKNLQAIDLQLEATEKQMDAADATLRERNYAFAITQHEEVERNIGEIYKNTALSVKANFKYLSDNVPYKLTDLTFIAASDPDDFIEIKQAFLEDPSNAAISAEAESFITGVQTAAAMKLDDSEYVVRFQKAAYDDFILLQEYQAELTRDGAAEGKTMQEMFTSLPANDSVKLELTRLKAKVAGYKRLGLYKSGFEMLNRASAIVNMHNVQQAKRLSMDVDDAARISQEGLEIPPVEDFYPSEQEYMTPKMRQDLEISLATIASFTPQSLDPTLSMNQEQLTTSIGQLDQEIAGLQQYYGGSSDEVVDRKIKKLSLEVQLNQLVNKERISTAEQGQSQDITKLSSLTGLTEDEIKLQIEELQALGVPWEGVLENILGGLLPGKWRTTRLGGGQGRMY